MAQDTLPVDPIPPDSPVLWAEFGLEAKNSAGHATRAP
jgi:hypothetical protein